MILGYCRIGRFAKSSRLEEQKRDLATIGAERFFCERKGFLAPRPELERAIASAGKGDVIAVTQSYIVAYSLKGVLAFIDRLGRRGIGFRVFGTPIDTSTTTGRMILGSTPLWSLGLSPLGAKLAGLRLRARSGG